MQGNKKDKLREILAKLCYDYDLLINQAQQQIKQYARDEWVLSEEEIKDMLEDDKYWTHGYAGDSLNEIKVAKAIYSKMRSKING